MRAGGVARQPAISLALDVVIAVVLRGISTLQEPKAPLHSARSPSASRQCLGGVWAFAGSGGHTSGWGFLPQPAR